MPLYSYRCALHGEMDIRHSMADLSKIHPCPQCDAPLKRVFTPIHHWWPSNHRPGMENSGQRKFLDPEFQARRRDKLAQSKQEHLDREAKKVVSSGDTRE